MAKIDFDLNDLTNSALKRLVRQLLSASDSQEQKILNKLSKPGKNDLADLHEEMHGKPNTPQVQDDSPFDLGSDNESPEEDANENSESDMQPKKRGKK